MQASLDHTAAPWLLIARWKRSAASAYPLAPVATVASFDRLWPWLLTGMLMAETRQTVEELRAGVEVSNN